MDLEAQVKLLLGITDTSKDGIIVYLISLVSGLALRYCKLSASTADLNTVLAGMIVERYRASQYGQDQMPKQVQSIREDDTQVNYAVRSMLTNELTDGEKAMLTPFRKMWP